ncbi:unnamed protein product [Durusdinium trenchii]|uniref:Uncharacterized protein n=2 Tax=Durusdinium trenchii TaxID=1381693 RepID=A0ABP0QEP2_9DINO
MVVCRRLCWVGFGCAVIETFCFGPGRGQWSGTRSAALSLPRFPRPDGLHALRRANREGLFQCRDRAESGKELSDEELFWNREYGPGGSFEFWSLERPKLEIERLCSELQELNGLSAVILGCGLGLDVAHLAGAARAACPCEERDAVVVGGVDFAWAAIKAARKEYSGTAGCFFYHADACELPEPSVPLDLLIDNTIFQNVYRSGCLEDYLRALKRISTPGRTLLHLNLMSREGIESRPEFQKDMELLNLPLLRQHEILDALSGWQICNCREGHYDLNPEAVGFKGEAFYSPTTTSPGIPSWCITALRS